MKKLLLIVLIFLVHSDLVSGEESQRIRSITINGNAALSEHQIIAAMVLQTGSLFSRSQLSTDLNSIRTLYRENGYYFADVTLDSLFIGEAGASVDVFLGVTEGEQVTIGEITVQGCSALTASDVVSMFDTHVGVYLFPEVLERDIDRLLSRYDRVGHPFATVQIADVAPYTEGTSTKLRIVLAIDEGSRVTIEEVKVAGNKETDEDVIVREARVKLHEPFDQEMVSKIPARLNRLNIFSRVEEPELYVNSAGGGLLISVQEGNTNTFDGVLGYAPGSSSGEGIVTGLVNVSMRNLFGTARKLSVRWLRDASSSQEIGLQYVEPWVFNLPLNITGGFSQRQQDTLYVRRGIETKADLILMESFSLGGTFTHDNVIPSNTTSAVFQSRTITGGLEVHYDTRDDIVNPTSGLNYRTTYQFGNKRIYGVPATFKIKSSATVQRVSLDGDFYTSPFQLQVLALGVHARQISSDYVELGDLYRFGGTNSLRGYREYQFLGSRIAWTNIEYRFLLARRSFVYGFFDTGYYFLPSDDVRGIPSSQDYKYGYGVGVRLETAIGNIGVSFAFGEGDSFTQGKIHFGLVNDF